MAPNSNNRSAARNDGQQDNNETSEFGEVYDQLCDNWKELCGQLRAFADNELQQAVRALSKDIIDDEQNIAWYNFAVRQKDELNKDINFYEIELDSLINQDDVEKFVQQFKEIRQSVQNMYNKSTMSFRICANAERPAPSSRIPIRASRDQAQSSRDQGRSNSIPASSRITPTHQDRLRRPPSSEAASSAPVSRENLQQSRISRPISSRNQPTQQSQSMLADQSRKSLLQQPNKRANASLGQRLSPHARNYPPLENASLSKMSVATQRQPQGARNAAPPPRITVRPPVQSTRAAAPTRAIAPPSRPPSAPPSQDPQTTPSMRPPARIPDAPLRPRVPAAPLRLAAPPSQDRTPVRTAASQSMPAASPARPAVSQSKYTTPERPTVPPARIPGAPLRPRDPAAPLRPAATTSRPPATPSRPPATPSRPPATPSRPPATPSRPVASSSQNRPTTRKVQPSVPSAYKKDAAFMERLRKEEIKQKEQLKNRLKVIKDQKERAEEKVIAGIATREPNKDDDIEEEQRDMDAETKEMQKQVDDFIEKMGVTIYDRPIPRSVTLAIEEIQQASTGDNPVKLLSILSVCSGLAYIKASQRLLTAVKDGLKAAVGMFKPLEKTDPLQHWIDMYTAIVTEVQEINGMLKEKYEHTNLEQYLNCGVKMAKFNEYNEKVLDSLRTELPLKNPKDMAKMVFDALLPLTYGRFCCNDSKDPGNPALEVRILRHPNILRKRDPNFMDEYVEDSWAEETSEASLCDEYARVKPTKGSPDAPMFITPPNKRIPATNVNPQKKSTLSPEYGEPSNQTPTGRPREQPATESTATATVSSSNMLGAAKRYASKSPDRHQSTQPSPSTSKGIRSTLPGKELEESVKKTDQEYEQLRNTTDLSDLIQSDSVSRNVKQKTPKKTGYVISALDHLQNLAHGKPPSTVLAAPMKNQPGYSRSQLNNLNKDIAQAVKNSPKTNVEIPVPTPTLKEPDLFYAIGWENEEDDDESLALSYRAGAMMDSNEMRELYISGQKKLLQYDIRTIEDMKRRVRDGQKFENGSDSEVDLAVSIAVAEALEESIRQDEIPLGVNKSNVDKRAAVEAVSLGLSKTGPTNDCSSPAKEVTVQPSNPAPAEPNGPNETNNLQKDNRNYPLGGITTVLYAKISQRRFEHSSLLPGSVSPPTNFAEYFCNYKKPSDATKESKSTSSLFTKAWSTVREDMHFL